jgi:hypothetical protein
MRRAKLVVRLALLLPVTLQLCGCGPFGALVAVPGPLAAGQRVRVSMPDSAPPTRIGWLVALTRDSLILGADSSVERTGVGRVTGRLALSLDAVSQLEVSSGVHRDVLAGALLGGLFATFGGLAVLCTRIHDCLGRGDTDPPVGQGFTLMMISTGAGVVVGGTVGAFIRSEHWDVVPDQDLNNERVAPAAPSALRLKAGLALFPAFLGPRARRAVRTFP